MNHLYSNRHSCFFSHQFGGLCASFQDTKYRCLVGLYRKAGRCLSLVVVFIVLILLGFIRVGVSQSQADIDQIAKYGLQYGPFNGASPGDGDAWGVDDKGLYVDLYVCAASKSSGLYVTKGQVSVTFISSSGVKQTVPIFSYSSITGGFGGLTFPTSGVQIVPSNTGVPSLNTGIEARAFNSGDAGQQAWTGYVPSVLGGLLPVAREDGGSNYQEAIVRWYIPGALAGQYIAFHDDVQYGMTSGATGAAGIDLPSQVFNLPATYKPSFTYAPSKMPGKMTVTYQYRSAPSPFSNYYITHWMDNDEADSIADNSYINASGSLDVGISNYPATHTFVTQYTTSVGLKYIQNSFPSVPAYSWPVNISANYDGKDTVNLQWTVPSLQYYGNNSAVTGDNFEVDRSTDPTFATNVSTVANYPYDLSKDTYNVVDNVSNITGGATLYYRLRRTQSESNWNWQEERTTNASVVIEKTQVADSVQLTEINGSPQALITWEPFRGVWTNGTTFSLVKLNSTTGVQSSSLNLTEAQARSGQYVDQAITYCNQFTYSIHIALGNGYSSPPDADVPGSALAVNIGSINNLTASKGYFPDHVGLQWESQGQFDDYIVERKIYGNAASNFAQITTVNGSSASTLQTTDASGQPGVYYEYMVVGAVKCNNETKYSKDTLYAVGFRSPTGNVYGRVTYSNGQAVENVSVRLQNDDNPQLGTSVYLNGQIPSYLAIDSLHTPFTDTAFTVSAWLRPDDTAPKNQVVFSQSGQYELGFDGNGQLYFMFNNQTVTGKYINAHNGWIHVAGIHSRDSLSLMINDSVVASVAAAFSTPPGVSSKVYLGRNAAGNNYKGYIDEMSLWNVAETPQQIAKNYTELLTGGETGLIAYWRFDETINNQFYDNSYQQQGNVYNQNDGTMDPAFVIHSNSIPDADQLSLKAYTDSSGNYRINGIPYTGNGTSYTIVPLFQTHQFSPISASRFVSSANSSFDVDFTDNSSFPVTGYVYYYNSTVPVKGVQFMIDGKYAQAGDGSILESDATGKFSISVPVGLHEVKAVESNHVFADGGKVTDQFGHDLNYQSAVGPLSLFDSTTIRFIGRVSGGSVQEAMPLGFSISKNNLGRQLNIAMTLPVTGKYTFIPLGSHDSTVYVKHVTNHDSLAVGMQDTAETRIIYSQNQITIYPDSLTGEFEADLIPVQFIASSANATGWGNILSTPVSLDFSNAFFAQNSVYNYQDSAQSQQGSWSYMPHTDTVVYNSSYKFTKRVPPSVSVVQVSGSGSELPYFGDTSYVYNTFAGSILNIPVVDNAASGLSKYLLGHPVFTKGASYEFKVKAFEEYPFYSGVKPDGTPIPVMANGRAVVDDVPTTDGLASVYDGIGDNAAQADTFSLAADGTGLYSFVAGDPEVKAPGTKGFALSVQFGAATNVNWSWLGNPQLQAYVVGGKLTGTDFVTAGPNKILTVLRDPPGSNSYSSIQSGSSISSSSTYTGTVDQTGDESLVTEIGTKLVTFVGLGGGVINSVVATNGITVGAHHEEHYTGVQSQTSTTTFTTQFQTSSDPGWVGADADLYVGYSTNITYGLSDNLAVIPRSDFQSGDVLIYQPSANSPYLVVQRQGLNFGQKFGTLFAYPQRYILNTLIPNLTSIRDKFLLPASSITPNEAQDMANRDNEEVYVSKLASSDPNFGKSNDDSTAFSAKAKSDPFGNGESYTIYFPQGVPYRTDTIMVLNEYVQDWKNQIARNEEEKLNATLLQNYSFHAGSPVSYSLTTDIGDDTTNSFNLVIAANILNTIDTKFNGAGAEFNFNESIGTQQGGSFEQKSDSVTTTGFELASAGGSEYLSVDVGKAEDGGLTFMTKGGATGCPYEPVNTTQFYDPGTLLGQPTIPIEVPKISVDNPVVNNVPATQKASYTLHLTNDSKINQTSILLLYYLNTDSVHGATISVDGASIANGRVYYISAGQTVSVVLTVEKGPTAMDYNNIPIILQSNCDTSDFDQVLISAHFVPSCSNLNIETPQDKWIMNTSSPVNLEGDPYLPVTLDNFDESNRLFDHIELQYKPSQNSNWITLQGFYPDSASYKDAQGQKSVITNAQAINYNFSMNNATFNDGPYDIRALAVCRLSEGNYISTPSNIVSGIKDVSPPVLFGHPQPANGILGIDDNVELTFNKPVAGGLLTPTDFQVTGIRNGSPSDHSVSIDLDGKSDAAVSEFSKNLTGRSFTAEMWVLPDSIENGTVFSQGNINESIELAFTNDNHLQATVGKKVIKSDKPLDDLQGQWSHVALEYNAADSTVSAFYNFQEVIHQIKVEGYGGIGTIEIGSSVSKQGDYFAGKIQNARIWTKDISSSTLQVNSLTRLSGSEDALLAYYPMDEGNGNVLLDKAHGNNMRFAGTWSTPPGKAMLLSGNGYVKINTGTIPITPAMNYTLGLWFKGAPGQTNATLLSNGKGDGDDGSGSKNLFNLGFESGLLTFENNGFQVQLDSNYLDGLWHHVAIAVNRISGLGQFFVDGQMVKYFDAQSLGGIEAPYVYAGARVWYDSLDAVTPHIDQYFTGSIDEVRIWNSYLDQSVLDNTYSSHLNGDEMGLLAYYPFDTYVQFQGQPYLNFTLGDGVENANYQAPDAVAVNAQQTDGSAPIKNRGPVANLNFSYVVNNNSLIINLLEPPQAVDKTIVTFKAENVQDQDGNPMQSPVTWTAFIDQNPLKWSDDELNLTKDIYQPLQFESYVVNSGGSNENFTLDNLPGWLTADVTSGTVPPEGKQKITFTVNAGLNVGAYNEIVYMRNDHDESQALSIDLKVNGQTPDWKVNPADFQYNMTLYGKIRVNNIFLSNPEDMLAAFQDGKCVGVASNTYIASDDLWYVFMTIYGDSLQYNNLEFRIWDADDGKIYEGVPSVPVSFKNDAVVGAPRSPVIFDGKEMLLQNINLNKGWSWISFNLAGPDLGSVPATLANGTWQSGDIVKHDLRGFDQYSYSAGWVGSLPGFDNTSLFKLDASSAQVLSIQGTAVDVRTTPISLKGAQWNYISYLPQQNMTLAEALAGYNAWDGDQIKSQTGFAMYDSKLGWVGNMTYLEPGKGYMLYRKTGSDTSFTYPYIQGVLRLAGDNVIADAGLSRLNYLEMPVANNYNYADNMTVTATDGKEFTLMPGDEILAYAGADLRGEAQSVNNPVTGDRVFFFNISGKNNQLIHFEVERNGKSVAQTDDVMSYMPNSMIGTLSRPFMLHFGKPDMQAGIYPNPFRNDISVHVTLSPGMHELQMSVYDVNGKIVAIYPKETTDSKYYQVTWNGRTSGGVACSAGVYFIHIFMDGVQHVYKVVKY